MISTNTAVIGAIGVGIGCYIMTHPLEIAKVVVKTALGTGITVTATAAGAIFGAYKGALKGAEYGEGIAKRHPGSGAFEIPIGFAAGGVAGFIAGGTVATVVSTIALSIL